MSGSNPQPTAAEVIAQAARVFRFSACTHPNDPRYHDRLATAVHSALGAAGYAIVKLPEGIKHTPTSPITMFPYNTRADSRGGGRVLDGTSPVSPEVARYMAASLLAAAAVAEGH